MVDRGAECHGDLPERLAVLQPRIRVPTNAAGGYSIQGATGSQLPVPVEGFRLQAAHPNNTATMPLQAAAFAPGQSSTVADIVFTGFGVIEITALRRDATPIEGLYVYVDNGQQGGATYTDAQGHAVFGGMRPGTYEFFGEVYRTMARDRGRGDASGPGRRAEAVGDLFAGTDGVRFACW
jgi:hypothetical protein